MSAATTRSATRVPQGLAVVVDELLDPEDLAFRSALGTLTLAAACFTAWVASTPPRVEELVVDARAVGVYVADLPRIPMPEPVVEPLRPAVLDGAWEPRPTRPHPAPAEPADTRGAPSTDADTERTGSLLIQELGTLGKRDDALATVLRPDVGWADLDAALRRVDSVTVARVGDAPARAVRDGDATHGIGLLGGGRAETGGSPAVALRLRTEEAAADVEVDAGDAAEIARVVKGSQGGIVTCLERALKIAPGTTGRVELGWSITGGRVRGVRVVKDTTGDPELAGCMARTVRSMRFPSEVTAEVASFPWVVSGG